MSPVPRVAVIGAGMAGVLSAIKLTEAGYADVVVYEKGDRIGGTWRENTYPGIACDVPSHLYSYSFAPNADWTHVFSPGPEIRDYIEEVANRHDVERLIRYNTEVTKLEFSDSQWQLETATGERDEFDVVIAATGVLHHPAQPVIDGLDSFEGPAFHSARWDHSAKVDGARVGVVGTGSSAVQIVGALVDTVDELHLFQRTPQWVLPVLNPPIAEEDKQRFRTDEDAMPALRAELSKLFSENFANAVVDADSPQLQLLQQMCQANLDTVVDPDLRERLRPDYRAACKRLIVSGNFYEAIQRPNARLVTDAIERVEPTGVRTVDGRLHELDVLVLATGFRVDRFLRPIEVIGRSGVTLDSVWAKRPSAYLAVSIPDFPNLFMLNGPNGPVGNFSLIQVAEQQFAYIAQLIGRIAAGEVREVNATHAATDRFEADRIEAAKHTVWVTGCRSWYLDDRGIPQAWPWGWDRFCEEMAEPRLADYELVTP
jgi:cation diffusion facilitator CzcD-associated flavoprotein CzcO